MDNNLFISRYANHFAQQGEVISLAKLLDEIRSGKHATLVAQIRNTTDDKARSVLKSKLPAVTLSGVFDGAHQAKNIKSHSGLMQIDIDKVANVAELFAKLQKDWLVYALFLSPSGNGLKIIVRVAATIDTHKPIFFSLENYFKNKYGIAIDSSYKDICRLMYLSSDPNIFINERAKVFELRKPKDRKSVV